MREGSNVKLQEHNDKHVVALKETVHIFGAGVNQIVKDWHGLSSPLMNNFFNIVLRKKEFADDHFLKQFKDVYDYIEKVFKKNRDYLAKQPFDLEMCFTFLERKIEETSKEGDLNKLRDLEILEYHFKMLLAHVLSSFDHFASLSHTMRNLGRVILQEKPTIITFNYDCVIEEILELTCGVNPSVPKSFMRCEPFEEKELPDEMLVYSHCNWNRPLGYGFKFDEIQLQQAGVSKFVRGSRFYTLPQNQLYPKPLLKLHGSLNWFRYTHPPIRTYPTSPRETEPKFPSEKETDTILKNETWWWGNPPDLNGWFILPVIITPNLYKDKYYNREPFPRIWKTAKDALSKCKKLVVIGYSFPPSDFSSKHLLIESFIGNDLDELTIINPDHNVAKVVKELCHFNGGVIWYSNLDDYLRTFSAVVHIESEPVRISEEDISEDTSPHDLSLKCKTCGVEFFAGIRTNPRSYATSQYIGNIHKCPNGHANSYDKKDYTLRKVD